ncbi:MAG: hypothetical protein AAGC58_12000 [Asticcacaulis sp.]
MAQLDRASARLYADLCAKIIADKSTDSALRKAGKAIGGKVTLPDGDDRDSPYFRICRDARNLPEGDALARKALIELAHAVARDLKVTCWPYIKDHPLDLVINRKAMQRNHPILAATHHIQLDSGELIHGTEAAMNEVLTLMRTFRHLIGADGAEEQRAAMDGVDADDVNAPFRDEVAA